MCEITIATELPSFENYLEKCIKISIERPDELCYQYDVVKPLLEKMFPDYQIVDTSRNTDTKIHTRKYYTLPKKKGKKYASPDLIIAENYVHENKKNNPPHIHAVIEIKKLSSEEMFNKDIKTYEIHLIYELILFLLVNKKVIATNCRRWQFFVRNNEFNYEFAKLFVNIYEYMGSQKDEDIDAFLKEVEKNKDIKNMLELQINNMVILSKFEKVKSYKEVIEIIARENVERCLVRTIDVLSNNEMIISKDKFTELKEPDEFVKNLFGLESQKFIIEPQEWYNLINYLPDFVKKM